MAIDPATPSTSPAAGEDLSSHPLIARVRRYTLTGHHVSYEGADAGIKARFPQGFPLTPGSGLAFAGRDGATLHFYGLTDRGPNADAPVFHDSAGGLHPTKTFPAPGYSPAIAKLRVDKHAAVITELIPIRDPHGPVSGLPLPAGTTGSTGEVALDEHLRPLPADPRGLDPEGIALSADGRQVWLADEYGPFLLQLDAGGLIRRRYAPGQGLPAVLAWRQPNRGCEGLTMAPNGKLYAALQSTLDIDGDTRHRALMIRLIELDPASGRTRMFGYPVTPADYSLDPARPRNGRAKLGDLVALDDCRFLVIEEGTFADGTVHNLVYLLDLSDATDLTEQRVDGREPEFAHTPAELAAHGIVLGRKRLVLDLRELGWRVEKAEGLALIDSRTLALVSDNDFGLAVALTDAGTSDPTELSVDNQGLISPAPPGQTAGYTLIPVRPEERATQLWIIEARTDFSALT